MRSSTNLWMVGFHNHKVKTTIVVIDWFDVHDTILPYQNFFVNTTISR